MSRRKQENPQPRKRLLNAEAELLQDTLTCGSCQKVFVLSEIVKFIQHKIHSCNKENPNFIIVEDGARPDFDDEEEPPTGPLVSRVPSISAPICNRKGLHHQHHHLHRNRNRADKPVTPGLRFEHRAGVQDNEGPIDATTDSFLRKKECEEVKKVTKEEPEVKQEVKDPSLRASPKIMVNAHTNTIITEPSTYTCSTCKQTFTSAWVLVQHAQHMHGMKIYLVTPYHGGRSSSNNSSVPPPPPSLINSSIPLPPVLPPCSSMNGPTHHHHHGMLPQQALSLENHPALQLLRMPLGERQFGPTSLNAPSLFPRPSSQDFRVDMLATSSSNSGNNNNSAEGSQQFHRLNHHHQQHLPSHGTPSIPGLAMGGFEPHNPFIDRGPLGLDARPRPPSMSLGFEPQMDFYSQRLRQLAGATSPTTVSASPRKLTPPFTHPPMSSSSQPSTPTSTPQPVLNLHTSSSDNHTPAPSQQHNNQEHRSSASSTSSKGGNVTDVAEGSPKLLKTWSCEFCGKSFRFQSNLIVHRRSHTGEKPYKCPICRHSCSQASKLKRHMKTHQSNNGKSTPASENNSMESPRSTPDSTSEAGKERRQRRRSLDEEEEGSDGQTADNEEEEEDLDDEDEEEDELDEEEDLEDSNEVMMAEDLSTRGPNSSTPVPRESPSSEQSKTKTTSEDVLVNNDNNSSNTISISNGENGNASNDKETSNKPEPRHSLISEVMDKIGLSNIQQYNEAYQKALEESSLKNSLKENTESSKPPVTENGPERLNNREDGNNNTTNSHSNSNNNKSHPFHPSMEFGRGFFGAFDYHHHNAFEMSKRIKLDMADHLRNTSERESLYAGLWLPSVHGSGHHRDLFDSADLSRHSKSSESALKSVTPTNLSPRPGTSGATVAPLLLNSTKGGGTAKEQRRNDTCEYCGKVFKNCSNLTVHRRSHTGEKPYKCELCSYACAQSSKLTRHMKTHGRLGKDVYRCRFCDMPFSVPSTLEKHMRKCVVNQNANYVDRDSDSKDLT